MTPEELEDRRRYIGSSESAAVVGLSPWRTPFEVWAEKTGQAPEQADNERMAWGRRLERAVMERYIEDATEPVQYPCAPVVHPEFPWMRATPDGLTPTKVVEIKTAGLGQAREWGEGGDSIPLPYLLQCTHLMLCTQRRLTDVAVLIAGNDFRTFSFELDDELAELLINREREFWQHVQDRTPPEVTTLQDAKLRWPKDSGVTVTASQEIADAVLRLHEINEQRDALEADADALQLAVKTCMGEASTLSDSSGQSLATWKAQVRSQFNFARFKAEHPGLYADFTDKIPTRVFRLAKGKQT
jgi:putative phage-type endonuclease